jgi:methionyl-tRNA formyltransferase
MNIILMGTGPFAVPMAKAIYASSHTVPLLVTRPQRVLHGKTQAEANPMRELATSQGTPIFDPESINTDEARRELARHAPDLFVVCDYGQILRTETLAVARLGGINLHGSLLPKYRGAAPINWAVYNGDAETGVTVIHMTPRIDAGPAIAIARLPIGHDDTAVTLEPKLAELGAPLVMQAINAITGGSVHPALQDVNQATKAPRLKKENGAVDWNRSAEQIRNQVRAFVPWPKTFTYWHRSQGEPMRLILDQVTVDAAIGPAGAVPGVVVEAAGDQLLVATGDHLLKVDALQPAGKRILTAAEFLRGNPAHAGDRFGPLPTTGKP